MKKSTKALLNSTILSCVLLYNNPPVFQESTHSYSNIDCLRANIFFEAQGESFLGKKAIAAVTYNRLALETKPSNICVVVFKPYQFSWTHLRSAAQIRAALGGYGLLGTEPAGAIVSLNARDSLAYMEASRASLLPYKELLKVLPKNVYYFHSVRVSPTWRYKMHSYSTIGQHIFYTKRKYNATL